MFGAYFTRMFDSSKSSVKWLNSSVYFFSGSKYQMEVDFENPTYYHIIEQTFSMIYKFKK